MNLKRNKALPCLIVILLSVACNGLSGTPVFEKLNTYI